MRYDAGPTCAQRATWGQATCAAKAAGAQTDPSKGRQASTTELAKGVRSNQPECALHKDRIGRILKFGQIETTDLLDDAPKQGQLMPALARRCLGHELHRSPLTRHTRQRGHAHKEPPTTHKPQPTTSWIPLLLCTRLAPTPPKIRQVGTQTMAMRSPCHVATVARGHVLQASSQAASTTCRVGAWIRTSQHSSHSQPETHTLGVSEYAPNVQPRNSHASL